MRLCNVILDWALDGLSPKALRIGLCIEAMVELTLVLIFLDVVSYVRCVSRGLFPEVLAYMANPTVCQRTRQT